MNQEHHSTEHKKGKHLTFFHRAVIQTRLKDKWSPYRIAKELGCSANTVRNEIRRGKATYYWGTDKEYHASVGQEVYQTHRANSHRTTKAKKRTRFLNYVESQVKQDNWSLDACVGYALASRSFSREEIVCTKTLYNYVDRGILKIKNLDLPLRVRRKAKAGKSHTRKKQSRYGRSIEERPACVASRERFGDWEVDLVIGSNSDHDEVLFTLLERKTRYDMVIRLPDKRAESVMAAFSDLRSKFKEQFSTVFKTITTDNGSEFAFLSSLEEDTETKVYYAHPYSSYEKGSNERHNGLLRRFIPKGKRIDRVSEDQLRHAQDWCNTLPRKILGYSTPRALFRKEMALLNIPF